MQYLSEGALAAVFSTSGIRHCLQGILGPTANFTIIMRIIMDAIFLAVLRDAGGSGLKELLSVMRNLGLWPSCSNEESTY